MTPTEHYRCMRVFVRLQQIVDRESRPEGDFPLACALAEFIGTHSFRVYGAASDKDPEFWQELNDREWIAVGLSAKPAWWPS